MTPPPRRLQSARPPGQSEPHDAATEIPSETWAAASRRPVADLPEGLPVATLDPDRGE